MDYEEKLSKLTDDDFFSFFDKIGADPRIVNSAGHRAIQVLGLCHHGHNHSVVFDPTTLKGTCYSECGGGFLFHTYVKRALDLGNSQEAKDFIEDWIDGQNIDFGKRISRDLEDFVYKERPFKLEDVPPIAGIDKEIIKELYKDFDTSEATLSRLVWHTKEGIDVDQLKRFDIAYYPKRKTIILPHHNINGEIVGLYERSFLPLRKEMKDRFPEAEYKWLCQFPRAKYVPLLKEGQFANDDSGKTSWSFSNIQNLYGLHLAKEAIQKEGKVIVFEGAKSVMLAHQYGFPYSVATHTFGINPKQISMLINAGAKEIIFAFDKQYQVVNEDDKQWQLYEKKTKEMARKIHDYVNVARIVDYFEDGKKSLLNYKDAPIDRGKENFQILLKNREILCNNGAMTENRIRIGEISDQKKILQLISKKKILHEDPVNPEDINAYGYEKAIYF